MENKRLSILIPSRNEEWLVRTIQDILENKEDNTEIIVGLDGYWSDPPIQQHKDVTIVHVPESIGQRAMCNLLCRVSQAKYIAKADAHCKFDKGFDRKMLEAFEETGDNVVMVPIMKNLHCFNWKCKKCGESRYQSPSGECKKCGGETEKDILWRAKPSPNSTSYCFDTEPHFQYNGEYKKKQKGDLVETMSLQGSFFMMTREKYFELDVCNEEFGSWGSSGIQIALSFWLSGGRVICNKKTWYAHLFRTQGRGFGFPYPQSGKQVSHAKKFAKELFFNNKYEKQTKPLSWLIEKFAPIKDWHEDSGKEMLDYVNKKGEEFYKSKGISVPKKTTKGIIYYTDNNLKNSISHLVRKRLKRISEELNIPIVSASLKPMNFGKNIHIKEKRGKKAYFKQILSALEASESDIIFFCEHDCVYHNSCFNFIPHRKDTFYFNVNVIKTDWETKKGLKVDELQQISGMCCYRELALEFYRDKMKQIEEDKFDRHYEPQHNRESWSSEKPIIDIRHENNLTASRWNKNEFRNQKYTKGWTEIEKVSIY